MRPLKLLGSVVAILIVVALAAACSSSSSPGSSGSGSSSPTSTTGSGSTTPPSSRKASLTACESLKVRDLHTNGTIAQSVVQVPEGTQIMGVAVDHSFVVWTAKPAGKPPIVCQASLASRRVSGLWQGAVASAPATTPSGVFWVTKNGTLWQVDHHGRRSRPIAHKVWHGVAYDPADGLIAYTDRSDPDHNRITVLKTHPTRSSVYRRFKFPTCADNVCTRIRSVAITRRGVAWTQRPTSGFEGLVSRRSFTSQGSATHRLHRTPAPALVPGFTTFAFSVKGGYDLWPLPAKHVTKAPNLAGQTLVAVGEGKFYTLRTTKQGVLLQAVSSNGAARVLDDLSVLQSNGETAQAGAVSIGPTRICEAVNVYPGSAPVGSVPLRSYVRCALLPRGSS